MKRRALLTGLVSAVVAPVALSLACRPQQLQVAGTRVVEVPGAPDPVLAEFVADMQVQMADALGIQWEMLQAVNPPPYSSARQQILDTQAWAERTKARQARQPKLDRFLRSYNVDRGEYDA